MQYSLKKKSEFFVELELNRANLIFIDFTISQNLISKIFKRIGPGLNHKIINRPEYKPELLVFIPANIVFVRTGP